MISRLELGIKEAGRKKCSFHQKQSLDLRPWGLRLYKSQEGFRRRDLGEAVGQLLSTAAIYNLDKVHAVFFFLNKFIYLFIYFWLCLVFVSVRGPSLVAASGDHSSLQCAGLSLSQPLLLRSTGSRRACSVVVAHGPSCSAACGIFPDQGSNPRPLHWQADSQPLRHQGSPTQLLTKFIKLYTL